MYAIIDRAYGFELQNASGVTVSEKDLDFLRDLAKFELKDGGYSDEFYGNPDEWNLDELIDFLSMTGFCWNSYSGAGNPPYVIGVSIDSWAYWSLEGPDGIIASAQITEPTEEELKAYNEAIPQEVKNIMAKHGVKPRVIWTSSTS